MFVIKYVTHYADHYCCKNIVKIFLHHTPIISKRSNLIVLRTGDVFENNIFKAKAKAKA